LSHQEANIEALSLSLGSASGEQRVDLLNKLASAQRHSDPDQVQKLSSEARDLARNLSYSAGLCDALNNLGIRHWQNQEFEDSRRCLQESLHEARSRGLTRQRIRALTNLGVLFSGAGHYADALAVYLEALKAVESEDAQPNSCTILNNLAVTYERMQEFDKALEYHERSLAEAERSEDAELIGRSLSNLGVIHRKLKDPRRSEEYLRRALPCQEQTRNHRQLAHTLTNLGIVYCCLEKFEQALDHARRALEVYERLPDHPDRISALLCAGNSLNQLGDPGEAKRIYDSALELAERKDLPLRIRDCCEDLAEYHALNEDYREAYVYQLRASGITRKCFTEEKARLVSVVEARYKTELFQLKNVQLAEAMGKLEKANREISAQRDELSATLAELDKLRGRLPVCAGCRKVCDDQGRWIRIEQYVEEHSKARFSEGLCPECAGRYDSGTPAEEERT